MSKQSVRENGSQNCPNSTREGRDAVEAYHKGLAMTSVSVTPTRCECSREKMAKACVGDKATV